MTKYRAAIEAYFLSISEVFFVRHWQSGVVLWLALLLLYPAQWFVGSLSLLISILLHSVFQVILGHDYRRWLGLNALLIGFSYVHYYGFVFSPAYWGWLLALLFVHQIAYYVFIGFVVKHLQLPLLTLTFLIVVKSMVIFFPPQGAVVELGDWAQFGVRLNAMLVAYLPFGIKSFFTSWGVLFFLEDVLVGLVVAAIILSYSRILFSIVVLCYLPVLAVRSLIPEGVNFEMVAFNCMITAMAIGGVMEIPSRWSYRNALLFGTLAFLLSLYVLSKYPPGLNVPFVLSVYAYLFSKPYFSTVHALPFDFYAGTPEQNLYYAQNRRERYVGMTLPSFALPFNGTWKVTQGYQGAFTHKDAWQHAWDFEQVDDFGNVAREGAHRLHEFYSYRQPVCATMDGEVVIVQNFVPDNEVGEFNFRQNWGNTVVVRHANGQCSAYSHLSGTPERITAGKWVNKGEVIGYCGNSGRSNRPHLHFQFQALPRIGDRTVKVPIKKFLVTNGCGRDLRSCDFPKEGEVVENLVYSPRIAEVFNFPFGKEMVVSGEIDGKETKEHWVSTVDFYNHTYLWCEESKAGAYFFVEDGVFYFSDYFGSRDSLLYYFSLAASRIVFTEHNNMRYIDKLPLNRVRWALSNFLIDIVTPLFTVKEVTSRFEITLAQNREVDIRNSISSLSRVLSHKEITLAESELSLPYGIQSIRVRVNAQQSIISFNILS